MRTGRYDGVERDYYFPRMTTKPPTLSAALPTPVRLAARARAGLAATASTSAARNQAAPGNAETLQRADRGSERHREDPGPATNASPRMLRSRLGARLFVAVDVARHHLQRGLARRTPEHQDRVATM
ncbi:MAG TPA: hypothetical protein VHS78_16995 [Candidatus Elarobacter sp.]|jgi:hypothetical protein|nr:hypothetical protein [Candidatus Elarobacter sp.]